MRKTILTAFLFSSLSVATFSQVSDSTYAKWLLTPEIKRGFDYALSAAKLTYKDFTFRTDYWEIDSARLTNTNHLMFNPLQVPYNVLQNASSDKLEFRFIETIIRLAGDIFSTDPYRFSGNLYQDHIEARKQDLMNKTKNFELKGKLKYDYSLKDAFFVLLGTTEQAKEWSTFFSLKYKKEEIEFIQNRFVQAILEDTSEGGLSVDQQDSIQKHEEETTREFVTLSGPNRYNLLPQLFVGAFLEGLNRGLASLRNMPKSYLEAEDEIIWEDKQHSAIIGGTGPNHYKGDYALIIDLGGDDTYELSRRPNFENQIIIDLGGNDKYFALEDYALACGNFGYSMLIDVAGDDLYQGKNFSVGCGFFGYGFLWDQAGNDTYIGDQFTQGAGGFGIGILKDDGGNDRYQAARASQGFGFVRGVGALLDANGSDNYFAGGKYKELIGLSGEIRYMSESQGYATGLRPDLSGGMGFLFDYDGDDSYNVDMFGQGSSYWWGLGALVDFKGNDRYLAQQYAQGAGVHMSLGCLVDSSGNDFYFSKGVSQGCGHDLGAGMLFDLSGNDNYVATDGSQAYGSANGFGILADGAGNDGYYVKDKSNTQGVGNPRREYGSIAVFLDCGGVDHYDGNGGENRIWKPEKTAWGVGVDGEFGALDTAQVKK